MDRLTDAIIVRNPAPRLAVKLNLDVAGEPGRYTWSGKILSPDAQALWSMLGQYVYLRIDPAFGRIMVTDFEPESDPFDDQPLAAATFVGEGPLFGWEWPSRVKTT
jgi:hypothetical protein